MTEWAYKQYTVAGKEQRTRNTQQKWKSAWDNSLELTNPYYS